MNENPSPKMLSKSAQAIPSKKSAVPIQEVNRNKEHPWSIALANLYYFSHLLGPQQPSLDGGGVHPPKHPLFVPEQPTGSAASVQSWTSRAAGQVGDKGWEGPRGAH